MLTMHADADSSAYHQLYSGATTMYDGAFGSDTSTPFEFPLDYESNAYNNVHGRTGIAHMQYPNATVGVSTAAGELVSERTHLEVIYKDIDLEALDKERGRSGRKSSNDKTANPYAALRRRAQNRASQAAFRARQQQRMKELEEKLTQLEKEHQDLSQSYESLQLQHSITKQELETLQRCNSDQDGMPLATTAYHWAAEFKVETSDPYLIDSEEFYYRRD